MSCIILTPNIYRYMNFKYNLTYELIIVNTNVTYFKKYRPAPNSASTNIAIANIMANMDITLAECSVSLLKALALSAKQVVY